MCLQYKVLEAVLEKLLWEIHLAYFDKIHLAYLGKCNRMRTNADVKLRLMKIAIASLGFFHKMEYYIKLLLYDHF